jgi:hypothetical protein
MAWGVPRRSCCVVIRIGWALACLRRVLFQHFHDNFYGLFQLWVMAASNRLRVQLDFDVWGDAVIFNIPRRIGGVKSEVWRARESTID